MPGKHYQVLVNAFCPILVTVIIYCSVAFSLLLSIYNNRYYAVSAMLYKCLIVSVAASFRIWSRHISVSETNKTQNNMYLDMNCPLQTESLFITFQTKKMSC